MISQYSAKPEEVYGVKNLMKVVSQRLTIRGFIVSDANMGPKYGKEHQQRVGAWLADGSFRFKTHVTKGIDNSVEGLLGMLSGKNFGKAVLRIADE
jgi:NADPH-dependent curcumin reductase CurA